MATDLQKHRATTIQVVGFAFMAPLGHFVLNFLQLTLSEIVIKLYFYIPIALVLFYFGTICLIRSMEIMEGKN